MRHAPPGAWSAPNLSLLLPGSGSTRGSLNNVRPSVLRPRKYGYPPALGPEDQCKTEHHTCSPHSNSIALADSLEFRWDLSSTTTVAINTSLMFVVTANPSKLEHGVRMTSAKIPDALP